MHPKSDGFLESSLYVHDVAASARFYATIFGFPIVSDFGERGCAMKAGERQVLLLFKKGGSLRIPSPHDGDGELHIAFAIPASELARWEAWLKENGIAIEEKRTWDLTRAYTFGIPTATCWKLPRPESGRSIDVFAQLKTNRPKHSLKPKSVLMVSKELPLARHTRFCVQPHG